MKPKPRKESTIQREIMRYLKYKYCCWKIPTVGTYKKKTGSYIPSRNKGFADILVLVPIEVKDGTWKKRKIATAWFLEVKNKRGKQTKWQKVFQEEVEKVGARYLVVRSVNEILEAGL